MDKSRIEKLRRLNTHPLLLKKPENLFYLLGTRVMHGYLLVKQNEVVFFGDGLEKIAGIKHPYKLKNVGMFLGQARILQLEDQFTFGEYAYLKEKLKNPPHPSPLLRSRGRGEQRGRQFRIKLMIGRSPVDGIRTVKEKSEIKAIRESMQIVERVFHEIKLALRKKTWTEFGLSRYIQELGHRFGAEDVSFPPIVASGVNAAIPHHVPSKKKLRPGESIILDMGFKVSGYCSDFTRTVFLKRAPKRLEMAYNQVEKAYNESMRFINNNPSHPPLWKKGGGSASSPSFPKRGQGGVVAAEVYQKAVDVLAEKHLDKYFIHNLGHGTGLEIHELPNLSPDSREVLKNGMVFSIEPGVYIPKVGGIRIEDLVYLKNGARRFIKVSTALKENIIL